MDRSVFEKWDAEGLLSDESYQKISSDDEQRLFSVHWELKTLLYLGIVLLTGGLGILVYKNIDSIGHQAVLLFIALICAGSFYYCFRLRKPFSTEQVASPNVFFDYILLLGCLTFLTFIAYLQYQYGAFGHRYGLATFIPMVILFFTAYYFDHIGILSLAITNLAAWLGIAVTPLAILRENDFNNNNIIFTGLLLGLLLVTTASFTKRKNYKRHFAFTYLNFGMHILFISCLAGMFNFSSIYLAWVLLLLGVAYYFYRVAFRESSFYVIVITLLYAYIGVSYMVIRIIESMLHADLLPIYLGIFYFIGSAIALVLFLMKANKKMKTSDSV